MPFLNSDGTESFVPNRYIFLAALAVVLVLGLLLPALRKARRKPQESADR